MNDIGPKDANVEIRSPAFHGVVGDAIPIERIATGFLFTEGPLWHAREKYLLFSDMPGDHMRKLSARGEVATFRKPCAQSNGLAWDRQGRLLVCEHATSKVTRTEADGSSTVIASHYAGKELNSPNDIVVKSDGSIYFSDPTYGRNEYYGNPRPLPRDFRGVYRAEPSADKLTLLADDFGEPNGLCFSRDERRLFVNDTDRQHIRVFDVRPDGTLANSRVLGGDEGRRGWRAGWNEDRQRRQRLLLRSRRHPRVLARGNLPRGDPHAGIYRELLLWRRRPVQPVRHSLDLGLSPSGENAGHGPMALCKRIN